MPAPIDSTYLTPVEIRCCVKKEQKKRHRDNNSCLELGGGGGVERNFEVFASVLWQDRQCCY